MLEGNFLKTIVLMDPKEREVPRGSQRQELHKSGSIVDFVDFHSNWCELAIRRAVEDAFHDSIDDTQPPPRLV